MREPGKALVILLSALAWVSITATQGGKDQDMFVQVVEPKNLSRLWLDSYANEPLRISVMVVPDSHQHLRISIDGTEIGFPDISAWDKHSRQRLDVEFPIQFLSAGKHNVTAQFHDSDGTARGTASTSFFDTRVYSTRERFGTYCAAAPIPDDDSGPDEMPGMSDFHVGWEGWEDWWEQTEEERTVRAKWGRRSGAGDEPWNERAVFRQYADFHHEVMSNRGLWKSSKFLIWRQIGGLGNAILSLVSAYVYALVTNRVLLVDSNVLHHLLQRPRGLSWHYSMFYDMLQLPSDEASFADLDEYLVSIADEVDFGCVSRMQNLLCEDYSAVQTKYLYVHGDQYFLPAILHNRLYRDLIRDWFGDDVFGTVARYLISPKQYIMSLAAKYADEHFEGKTSVGIQLRTQNTAEDVMPESHMPPFAWKDWISSFWKCAYLSSPPTRNSSTYFLATDAPKRTRASALAHLRDKVHWIDGEMSRKSLAGFVDALVDMIVLSLCDDLVTTAMSTFGNVAAGLGSIVPLVVTHQSTCYRELSSQPCFHKWGAAKDVTDCYDGETMLSPEVRFCGLEMRAVPPAHPEVGIL